MGYSKIIITSDLLRVDNTTVMKLENPQKLNIDWLCELLGGALHTVTGKKVSKLIGGSQSDLFSRLNVYRDLELLINADSWAKIYEGEYKYEVLEHHLDGLFEDALVFTIEAPDYLIKYFIDRNVPYIDFSIHPVRYLNDYYLGVRTNVEEFRTRIDSYIIPPHILKNATKLYKAKARRVYRTPLKPNSAVFFGQTEIDSSLIYGGRFVDLQDIENCLRELTQEFDWVYFKSHPHAKRNAVLKQLISTIPKCEWLETNAYMLLSRDEIELCAAFSSGILEEAKIFGKPTRRLIGKDSPFDLQGDAAKSTPEKFYRLITHDVFSESFWSYVLHSRGKPEVRLPYEFENILKTSLNVKWGV
ncbi:hypothetical protein [Gynuella sunshinyii]|uniref:Capsule polysaccharide export protein n=1 Tax=Gynuella sunshinyii YC6258 TaxID=1445510 RepID=A0A0C5VVL5_9GAMM|nr:hypothetical protein [Gynuella sunshinyii]AJQ97338.1 hypothetical Protein YC6258_05308 [Gynuella sunshinyii YC6258]